jgi:single-strand selective monofunctional uracil DNA glycosylase
MMPLLTLADALSQKLAALQFAPPVSHVYNVWQYARDPGATYLRRYGRGPKKVLLLGMNPGPFGMAQTGVPFGEVAHVRDWLGIDGEVGQPSNMHPARPVTGFACPRSEVSGARLWGWAKQRFGTPEAFFADFFVYNWCPLAFMSATGRNITPDTLPQEERLPLFAACDEALAQVVRILKKPMVIGVGGFATKRAVKALPAGYPVGTILHPSPASPVANRGWAAQAEAQLTALGIRLPKRAGAMPATAQVTARRRRTPSST